MLKQSTPLQGADNSGKYIESLWTEDNDSQVLGSLKAPRISIMSSSIIRSGVVYEGPEGHINYLAVQ